MDYHRRKFIKTVLFGTGGFFASSFSFPLLASMIPASVNKDDILELKRSASKAFYLREYDRAELLYKNLIAKYPSDITCYDGLAKIYYKHSKYVDVISLLQEGIKKNLSTSIFYDRLARCFIKLSLGNFKQESEYISSLPSGNRSLIERAMNLYIEAIKMDPNKKYLREGLLDASQSLVKKNKVLKAKKLPLLVLDAQTREIVDRETSAYKESWEKTRLSQKENFQQFDKLKLTDTLENSKKRKRREVHFDNEHKNREDAIQKLQGKCYRALLTKSILDADVDMATKYYNLLNQNAPKDSFSKEKIVRFYKRVSANESLQSLYENEVLADNHSIWSEIGLAQTLIKRNKNIAKSREMLSRIKANSDPEQSKMQGAISFCLAECNFRSKEYDSGRQNLMEAMDTLVAGGVVNSLIISYAVSFLKEGKYQEAKNILLRYGGNDKTPCNDKIAAVIDRAHAFQKQKHKQKNKTSRNGKLRSTTVEEQSMSRESLLVLYALAKTYKKMGDTQALADVLNKIRKIDPDDKFLKNIR